MSQRNATQGLVWKLSFWLLVALLCSPLLFANGFRLTPNEGSSFPGMVPDLNSELGQMPGNPGPWMHKTEEEQAGESAYSLLPCTPQDLANSNSRDSSSSSLSGCTAPDFNHPKEKGLLGRKQILPLKSGPKASIQEPSLTTTGTTLRNQLELGDNPG